MPAIVYSCGNEHLINVAGFVCVHMCMSVHVCMWSVYVVHVCIYNYAFNVVARHLSSSVFYTGVLNQALGWLPLG